MADTTNGHMNTDDHEKVFEGFVKFATRAVIAIIIFLIFLAFVNA